MKQIYIYIREVAPEHFCSALVTRDHRRHKQAGLRHLPGIPSHAQAAATMLSMVIRALKDRNDGIVTEIVVPDRAVVEVVHGIRARTPEMRELQRKILAGSRGLPVYFRFGHVDEIASMINWFAWA